MSEDIGIRIRADARFARLIDKAAELTGQTRSAFIRDAALAAAAQVIRAWTRKQQEQETTHA